MNRKAKGSRRELQVKDHYESKGYKITKAGASLGVWDLVGYDRDGWVCIQVKANKMPGRDEMATIKKEQVPPNTTKLVIVIKDRVKDWTVKEIK